jgi:starch phosphorylase
VLDGWWPEGYSPDTGWAIGRGEEYEDPEYQDAIEGHLLYDILEREVIPLFYTYDEEWLPRGWIKKIKTTLKRLGYAFSSNRMVTDYTEQCYLNADSNYRRLSGERYTLAKEMAHWRQMIEKNWGRIRVLNLKAELGDEILHAGDEIPVVAEIELGDLKPEDVIVELYHGLVNDQEMISDAHTEQMKMQKAASTTYVYKGKIVCQNAGRYGFTLRVLPGHSALPHHFLPGLILWA